MKNNLERELQKALIANLNSIANLNQSLSSITNAETDKLLKLVEKMIRDCSADWDLEQLQSMQDSIFRLLDLICKIETILKQKLELILSAMPALQKCDCKQVSCECDNDFCDKHEECDCMTKLYCSDACDCDRYCDCETMERTYD